MKVSKRIEIDLVNNGSIPHGIDYQALIDDIQSEIDKLDSVTDIQYEKIFHKPPEGAQGDIPGIEWLLDFLTDPDKAKFYARTLIYTLNQIITSLVNNEGSEDNRPKTKVKKSKKIEMTIKFFGKELVLPTLTDNIEDFLDSLE